MTSDAPPHLSMILASRSPRRAELLRAAGIPFEVLIADVDEATCPGENPEEYVARVAGTKAAVISRLEPARVIVAADTVVVVDEQILGKPADSSEARRMLELLSGRRHLVLTGVCLVRPARADAAPTTDVRVEATIVEFSHLTADELEWYVASGEPMDKAGAYAIQGLASRFVTRIEGSYSNVVGLPVALLYRMCTASGILVS